MRFLLYCILSKKKNPNPQIPEIKQPLASCWTSSWSEAREVVVVHRNTHSSWWFQPTQNLCASRIGSFPQGSGFKTKQIVETTTLDPNHCTTINTAELERTVTWRLQKTTFQIDVDVSNLCGWDVSCGAENEDHPPHETNTSYPWKSSRPLKQ